MPMQYQGDPINTFLKGIGTGSDMFHKIMNARYNNSLHPSGDVANAMYVEQLKAQYGENDPRYLQAKRAHDMAIEGHQSLIDYRGELSALAPYRATSALGKSIAEGKGEGALDRFGNKPKYDALGRKVTGSQDGYDDQKARAYEMDIAKKTTDPDARKRYNFAVNIDKTRERINPDDLLAYSGLEGTGRMLRDQALSATGKAPDALIKHNKALTAANTLAKQVRQFYGDSIQPEMEKKLTRLTNPATWYKNPDLAMAEYQAFNDILDAETQTYKDVGTSPIKLRQQQQASPEPSQSLQPENPDLDFATAISSQLIDTLPDATPENILQTAKDTGKTVNEVVQFLINKRNQMIKGGQ